MTAFLLLLVLAASLLPARRATRIDPAAAGGVTANVATGLRSRGETK
jgi:hypothetical protein